MINAASQRAVKPSVRPPTVMPWLDPSAALQIDFTRGSAALNGRPVALSNLVECGRASVAWGYDSKGNIKEFGPYRPRVTDKGLLAHEAVTNSVPHATDFSADAGWVHAMGGCAIEGGYLAPDGTNTAQKLTKLEATSHVYAFVPGDYRSIFARTVSGTGTLTVASRSNGTISELTEEWLEIELHKDYTGNIPGFLYAVDFRAGTLNEVILWGAKATDEPNTPPQPTSGTVPNEPIKLTHKAKAPMYELGPELLPDGLSGFGNGYSAALSEVGSSLRVSPLQASGNGSFASYEIPTVIGRTYRFVGNATHIGATGIVRAVNDPNAPWANLGNRHITASGDVVFEFKATSEATHIFLGLDASNLANAIQFNSGSVREVIPIDFTIEMEFTTPADFFERTIDVLGHDTDARLLYCWANSNELRSYDGSSSINHKTIEPGTRCRIVMAVSAGQLRSSVNGEPVVTSYKVDLSGIGSGEIFLGSRDGVYGYHDEHIHDFKLHAAALSDAELQARSAL